MVFPGGRVALHGSTRPLGSNPLPRAAGGGAALHGMDAVLVAVVVSAVVVYVCGMLLVLRSADSAVAAGGLAVAAMLGAVGFFGLGVVFVVLGAVLGVWSVPVLVGRGLEGEVELGLLPVEVYAAPHGK